ncbi:MAG: hypothetical protein KatS3mg105_2669 [Gemmatales bacterium]|nr:MAG: hypothetical protein KatS3mg105_2669 [Gemmatales bacterium]
MSGRLFPPFAMLFFLIGPSIGMAGTTPGAAMRWSKTGPGGTPEFERHVLPLLGKLGCSNRACHGSFQGQNGFRLSLFASDPQADRDALALAEQGKRPRIDLANPEQSLAITKPSLQRRHRGGKRFDVGSWQHRLLLDWIRAGAPYDPKNDSKIERLQISPTEIVTMPGRPPVPLRLLATFSDGTSEDVTPLTTFDSQDDGIAKVSEDGLVHAVRAGDTGIIATYGGRVVTCQVLVPRPDDGIAFPDFPANNRIDVLIRDKLQKLNIRPSELCSDEVFLRRAYLDVTGTLPTPSQARRFLSDKRPDRRARLIDELLARPEYATYWASIFCEVTGANGINPHPQVTYLWHDWLEEKLRNNWPYDRIVGGILTATSLEGRSRQELLAEIDAVRKNMKVNPDRPYQWTRDFDRGVYAKRKTLDLYWLRIPNRQPERIALQTATSLLGIRLQCAQCHKHPFDRWTKQDFDQFQSFFKVVEYVYAPTGGPLPRKGRICYGRDEIRVGVQKRYQQDLKRLPPKLPGGDVIPYEEGSDPRVALWEWMRSPDNPYFAPCIVNRIWAHYFGIGIVNPIEDLAQGNPPSNPKLLQWLARDFIASGFDLKHLHRQILNSRTYQLSWIPNDSNRLDKRSFSHAQLRRLPAEVLLNIVATTTGIPYEFSYSPPGTTPLSFNVPLRTPYSLQIFGRGPRKQACGNCERSNTPALNQALYLLNDDDINSRVDAKRGRLLELQNLADDRDVVEELYLAALSRFPTKDEMNESLRYRLECDSRAEWMEDLLWSLLNVREFVFNH